MKLKMKNLLTKIPFINIFFKQENDWHDPKYILKVISEKELRKIRKRILKDLKKEKVINPKSLYYLRKYVDASFNKKTVNIEGRFIEKQNELEQFYSSGKAEVYQLIAEYYDILREIREADERLKKAVLELEPSSKRVVNKEVIYKDDISFYKQFNELPDKLDWGTPYEKEQN